MIQASQPAQISLSSLNSTRTREKIAKRIGRNRCAQLSPMLENPVVVIPRADAFYRPEESVSRFYQRSDSLASIGAATFNLF